MSTNKEIEINVYANWDIINDDDFVLMIGRHMLNPFSGMKVTVVPAGFTRGKNDENIPILNITISGAEAIPGVFFESLFALLQGYTVPDDVNMVSLNDTAFKVKDIENDEWVINAVNAHPDRG